MGFLDNSDDLVRSGEHSSLSLMGQLMAAFQQQFGSNQAALNFLNGKMQSIINNPQGFSPEALASLKTNAIQQTATDYANASKAVNGQIAARGGSTLPSGVTAQIQGGLAQGAANEESGSLNQINLANEQQRQSNFWEALSADKSIADAMSPDKYASGANGAAAGLSSLGSTYLEGEKSGFGGSLMKGLGSGIGAGLSGLATGSLTNDLSQIPGIG